MQRKALKPKACKVCGDTFQPQSSFAKACKPECAIKLVVGIRERKVAAVQRQQERLLRAETRAMKEAIRPLKWYADRARDACHDYIRFRDRALPCISCGRYHDGKYDAGHYRPSGINSATRYDENNINRQCNPCNTHMSGNLTNYRIGLIAKIGEEAVVALETNREVRRYSKEELIEIRKHYQQKLKQLKAAQDDRNQPVSHQG